MTSSLSKIAGFAIAAVMVMLLDMSAGFAAGDSRVPGPAIDLPTEAKQCIRPTDFMRRNHMNLLTHKRDLTMRDGIRTKDASLQGCVDCHSKKDANGTAIPVNAEGQFCSTCHEYAAVKIDCFECHRTTPDTPGSTAAIPDIPSHSRLLASNSTAASNSNEVRKLRSYLEEAQ